MPIVPRVNPAPLPGARFAGGVSDAAFGGGAGNAIAGIQPGLSAVHDEAAKIAQEEVQRADQIAVTDGRGQLLGAVTDQMWGQNGVLTRKGKDAFTAPEDIRASYFKAAGAIRASLGNDRQRDAFDSIVAGQWNQINEQVQSHVAQQRQVYDTQSTAAAIENAQNVALQSYDQPQIVEPLVQGIRSETQAYGARNGWSGDQIKQMADQRVSDTRVGVLSRMLDHGDDQNATAYYAAHKDEIAGPDQAKIERALEKGSIIGTAARIADQIVSGQYAPGMQASGDIDLRDDQSPVTYTDALTRAESVDDPNVRDEVVKRLAAHFNELNTAQRVDRENARARVLKDMEQNGGRLNQASSDWQLIDGYSEGEQVLARQHQILHPPTDPGDPDKVANYLGMLATTPETRQQFLSIPISEITNDQTLNPAQKSLLINRIIVERGKDVSNLRRAHADAQAAVKTAQKAFDDAQDDGDDDAIASARTKLDAAKQHETVLRGHLTRADRLAHLVVPPTATPDSGAPTRSAVPAPSPKALAGLDITPAPAPQPKPMTPDQVRDLQAAAAAGPVWYAKYADHLRAFGYDVPAAPTAPRLADTLAGRARTP